MKRFSYLILTTMHHCLFSEMGTICPGFAVMMMTIGSLGLLTSYLTILSVYYRREMLLHIVSLFFTHLGNFLNKSYEYPIIFLHQSFLSYSISQRTLLHWIDSYILTLIALYCTFLIIIFF